LGYVLSSQAEFFARETKPTCALSRCRALDRVRHDLYHHEFSCRASSTRMRLWAVDDHLRDPLGT